MNIEDISPKIANSLATVSPFLTFYTNSTWRKRRDEADIADFVLGNPHEMPMQGFVDAMRKWSQPQNKDWFAYKDYIPSAQKTVAASLSEHRGISFQAEDILLNTGAFAGLTVILGTLVNPGDEVIFISPPWFFYEGMILHEGGVPVRVKVDMEGFGLDLKAIEAAITSKTKAIIVNSPNNPTGRIYPEDELKALAKILSQASEKHNHRIYLISDEAYCKIVYEGKPFPTPAKFYADTFLIYTYGKQLLIPGQRIGYIALPPKMADRETFRDAIFAAQLFMGYPFANAVLQYALTDIEKLSIDIRHLEEKRNRVVGMLRDQGYEAQMPEGTFYVLVRSPWEDDMAFMEVLAKNNVFCLPGSVFEMPGYFRISLTANDEMIDRGLPGFARAIEQARSKK